MITIKVDTTGIRNLNGRLTRFPEQVNTGVRKFTYYLANRLSEAAPYGATGYLKRTLLKPHRIKNNQYVIKAPYYIEPLEKGTGPHFIPHIGKTELWAKKHGMSFGRMKLIIATRGTKPHPFTNFVIRNSIEKLREDVMNEVRKK